MKLSTPILVKSPDLKLNYGSQFFNIGSCFANNLANKLSYFGFKTQQNPVGILFHPFAIEQFCKWLEAEAINLDLFVEQNKVWKSLQAHSVVQGETPEDLLFNLQKAVVETRNYLKTTDTIFITFGTAFVYHHLPTKKYVANCQKQHSSLFKKELIEIKALVEAMQQIIKTLSKFNQANIYISVSPVRHIKDGLVENNLSKANLLAAVHHVIENNTNVDYFPAYEIVMDELRDYRFYNRDLLHPNELAIDYVWEKFSIAFFEENALQLMHKVGKYRKLSAHRPLQENKATQLAHLAKINAFKQDLLAEEPHLQLDK
ncbi:GSCFA domain-containing protein [Psychroflexus salis]|uniref:GSCFA domain-containing protein n=1 Tax=Psychroflexus salis TaxID=1526574 RepID=A0A917EBL5_9FLAO|nr:GSCFA domain-containing protein [Psychroflexus salis]GGE18959.1 hypothetical protein GCM10010831_20180 [Psychroflexus salis]